MCKKCNVLDVSLGKTEWRSPHGGASFRYGIWGCPKCHKVTEGEAVDGRA